MPPLLLPASIRWILFDAVGTLIFPHPPAAKVYHQIAARYGSELTISAITARFSAVLAASHCAGGATSEELERERWRQIVAQVIDDAPAAADAIFDELWKHFARPGSWRVFPGIAETLSDLRGRGYRLGIASNFDGRLLEVLPGHPELQCFDRVLVSSALGYAKPDPRFFRAAEAILAAQPDEIALIGDDEIIDIAAARAAKWHAIHLARAPV